MAKTIDLDESSISFLDSLEKCEPAEEVVIALLMDMMRDGYDVEGLAVIARYRLEAVIAKHRLEGE